MYKHLGIIVAGDFAFPVNLESLIYRRFFLWQDWSFLGYAANAGTYNLISLAPIYLLNKIGLPLELIEKLFFFSIFFIGAASMYVLLNEIIGNFKWKRLVCLVASIFYIFNPYVIQLKLGGYMTSMIVYSFAPLLFYFIYKYLKTKNYLKNKYLYLFGVILFISLSGGALTPYITWLLGIAGLYFVFLLISLLLPFLPLNSVWIPQQV